jgi:hypothetical protein
MIAYSYERAPLTRQLGGDLGKVLVRVLGKPGHPGPEHAVVPVAGEHVGPRGNQPIRVGDLGQGRPHLCGSGRLGHRPAARLAGGCQVGSGSTTPNP